MTTQIVLSALEMLGIGAFIYWLIRGLQAKISSLEGVVKVQNDTLEVMERRVQETEKVGNIYKKLLADLPVDLDNYKAIVSKTKDEIILELKSANEEKGRRIRELKDAEERITTASKSSQDLMQELQVLKNLLTNPNKHDSRKRTLREIAEFDDRRIEEAVPHLIKSGNVSEFLARIGYNITKTDDDSILKDTFGEPKAERPRPYQVAMASLGERGWYVVRDNQLFLNHRMLTALEQEFIEVKTLPA